MTSPPLSGVRVLDLSRLLPGPYCSQLLADLGADVLKLESPDPAHADLVRVMPPHIDGAPATATSAAYVALAHGKRSVALDLRDPAAHAALLALVDHSDVLLDSFRPGVLDRLSLGWNVLSARNPRLIHCSITGYGQTGPDALRAGHDIGYLARAGVLGVSGAPGQAPLPPGAQLADLAGGALPAVIGILAALRERDGGSGLEGSGLGQQIDVSMVAGSRALLALEAPGVLAGEPQADRGTSPLTGAAMACYRTYECADGWVALGALEHKFWRNWCAGVERPDLVEHQGAPLGSAGAASVEAVFLKRTKAEWAAFAAEHDCCLEPVLSLTDAFADPVATQSIQQRPTGEPTRVPAPPFALSRSPLGASGPAPALGAHTIAALRDAGVSDEQISALLASGAAATPVEVG